MAVSVALWSVKESRLKRLNKPLGQETAQWLQRVGVLGRGDEKGILMKGLLEVKDLFCFHCGSGYITLYICRKL